MEVERSFCQYCKQILKENEIDVCLYCQKNFVFQSDIIDIFGYAICEGLQLSDLNNDCIIFHFSMTKDQSETILETIKEQKYVDLFNKMLEIEKNSEKYIGIAEQTIWAIIQ